jgi:hypothetical protein
MITFKKVVIKPGTVAHTCDSSTWEAEAGGSQGSGQPGLHSETHLKNRTKQNTDQCHNEFQINLNS